jgi:hypothetical protein
MVIVVSVAHSPTLGVNVYVVVCVLSNKGNHVPLIGSASSELVGKGLITSPEQIAESCVKTGFTGWLTSIVIVVSVAHSPTLGVNVYVVVCVLSNVGNHVPLIGSASSELVGKGLISPPEQIDEN